MAAGKQTPRQAMIGLMYLVLLAMLAMNASKDLLNAFILLDNGINVTNENLEAGNQTIFEKIRSSAALGSDKAVKALKNATSLKTSATDLVSTINLYKKELVELGGGVDEDTGIPYGKENQDVGAEYLMTAKKGEELKEKIGKYRKDLIAMIDTKDTGLVSSISQILATPQYVDYENNATSWEAGISEHLPLVAVTANLSNLETYIQNAETQLLGYLYEGIALDTYKVNKILATSISQKSYVLQGEDYSAQVFLAAADTTQEPMILVGEYDTALFMTSGQVMFLGDVDSLPVNGGIGDYNITTNETGVHTWGGIMKVPHPNPKRKGEFLMYPFKSEYTVAAPTAVISSEQLSIMYLGLSNEISVSAPGMSSDKIDVRASNRCSVSKKSDGKYVFKPTRTGRITVQVIRKEDGKVIANQNWTGKRLPKPLIWFVNDKLGGRLLKNKLNIPSHQKFSSRYSPSFPLSANVTVLSCKIEALINGNIQVFTSKKGEFPARFQKAKKRLKSGDWMTVTMRVRDASGITHPLIETVKIR
ncbi:MAG: gliding motility-associated protein GldM [Saprospiraceae bacterium]|jgi:gliding motility-associated protein GldM